MFFLSLTGHLVHINFLYICLHKNIILSLEGENDGEYNVAGGYFGKKLKLFFDV
jgi:hypothetical protein